MATRSDWARVLDLILSGEISHPALRKQLVSAAAADIVGSETAYMDEISAASDAKRDAAINRLARDLRAIEISRGGADNAGDIQDEAVKDRISRVFMSSSAFKMCAMILAVGTALFGVNLGILTLDTSAVNRTKAEAIGAANDAKQQAENARSSIANAIAGLQLEVPRLVAERINIEAVEMRVAASLTDKLSPRFDVVGARIEALSKDLDAYRERVSEAEKRLGSIGDHVGDLERKIDQAEELTSRWETAVTAVGQTAADQSLARVVWLVLRRDAFFLVGSLLLSALALLVALWSLATRRRPAGPGRG